MTDDEIRTGTVRSDTLYVESIEQLDDAFNVEKISAARIVLTTDDGTEIEVTANDGSLEVVWPNE